MTDGHELDPTARYLTSTGQLTVAGVDAGREIDDDLRRGTDWDDVAAVLEVHPVIARRIHTTWCEHRDHIAAEAQFALF